MERLPEDHIRLLSFSNTEGSEHDQILRRTLMKLPADGLDSRGTTEYIALSYCCGTEREIIQCDGEDIEIYTNLANALPLLHQHFPGQLIWADSLCINQKDLIEKGVQISLMSKIYQHAVRVVVWLGTDTEDIYDALQQRDILLANHEERISLLTRVAAVPWFYRAWTFQEIRLGRSAVVLFGSKIMDWKTFIDTVQTAQRLEPTFSSVIISSYPSSFRRFTWTDQDRFFAVLGELNTGITVDLAGLLFLTWYRASKEKEDKIYSVLGLVAKEHLSSVSQLAVDYNIDWRALCIKVARLCISISSECQASLHPRLKILKISGMVEGRTYETSQLLNHPSWAPDWREHPQRTRSFQSLTYDKRGVFDRLSFCCSDQPPAQDLEDISPFLVLKGVLIGLINIGEGKHAIAGQLSVHAPPSCAGYGHEAFSSSQDPDSPESQIHIPKVNMSMFTEAVQGHFDRSCFCFRFPHRQVSHRQSGISPLPDRFDNHGSFSVTRYPEPADVPEGEYPAQVLSPSVKSGDWLVLLEGGGMPFILRPLSSHGRIVRVHEISHFAHKTRPLPDDGGCFVLVGEASVCWDKLWPRQWEPGRWGICCRAGTFIIV